MDQAIKTRWVEALRSGDYQQGSLRLRTNDDKFCCLGVLCDIIAPQEWYPNSGSWSHRGGANAYLPPDLREMVGLSSHDENRLGIMNDKWKYDFEKIATMIEEMM